MKDAKLKPCNQCKSKQVRYRKDYPLWMVMGRDGKDRPWQPYAAYGSRIQAEVYASGFSSNDRVKIVAGAFSPNSRLRSDSTTTKEQP